MKKRHQLRDKTVAQPAQRGVSRPSVALSHAFVTMLRATVGLPGRLVGCGLIGAWILVLTW